MANDLESPSPDLSGDALSYAFIEDALDESDALESVGQESADLISVR